MSTNNDLGEPLVRLVAAATADLDNRAAWAAMGELIEEAGVPSSDRGHHRKAAWAVRAQLRQGRPDKRRQGQVGHPGTGGVLVDS
jgi:hypothetical protein